MLEGFQKFIEKYRLEKWFQKENLIILILSGILLVVIALPTGEDKNAKKEAQVQFSQETSERQQSGGWVKQNNQEEDYTGEGSDVWERKDTMLGTMLESAEYVSSLESKLAALLSGIEGAGNVSVMITLQESEEQIIEKDVTETEETAIYAKSGSDSVPYVIKTVYPKVGGVVVVASGAGTGRVTQVITEAVKALFDIEPHKIKVVEG